MTTNVPQDVIDYTLVLDVAKMYGLDYNKLSAAYRELLRAQRQQVAEPVAWRYRFNYPADAELDIDAETSKWHYTDRNSIPSNAEVQSLYTTPPQANALVAAAYRKAAEIAKKRSDVNWEIGNNHAEGSSVRSERHDRAVEAKLISEQILSAIPKNFADALKEYVSGKCMEVAIKAEQEGWHRGASGMTPDLQAIVNSVLEGGK